MSTNPAIHALFEGRVNFISEVCTDFAQAFITNAAYCALADENGDMPEPLNQRVEELRQIITYDPAETSFFLDFTSSILSEHEDLYTNEATEKMMGVFLGKKPVFKVRTVPGRLAAWVQGESVEESLQTELVTSEVLPVIALLGLRKSLAQSTGVSAWGQYQVVLSAVDV